MLCAVALPASAEQNVTMLVSSSTLPAYKEIVALYEKNHPGIKVSLSGAGSGIIAKEVQSEAQPIDLIVVTETVAKGLSQIDASSTLFESRMILYVSPNGKVKSLKDLANPGVSVIGNTKDSASEKHTRAKWPNLHP